MDSPKIYLSGNISSLNSKLDEATRELRSLGYIVRNPVQNCNDLGPDQPEQWLKARIAVMISCDHVLMLDDWYEADAAAVEYRLARELKIPVDLFPAFIARLNLKPIE